MSEVPTVPCTLLFADVARYTLLPDPAQKRIIQTLHQTIQRGSPGSDLTDPRNGFFVATGDGMLLAFRDNSVSPSQIVEFASLLQKQLDSGLRIGLSRGECETYADFNSAHFYRKKGTHNNIAGTAVNMTQRVMSLGDPGDVQPLDAAAHMASEPKLLHLGYEVDSRVALPEGAQHRVLAVPDRGDHPQPGDDDPPHAITFRRTRQVLTPPKPNALLTAMSSVVSRARFATRLMPSHCGSSSSRLMVGATKPSRIMRSV